MNNIIIWVNARSKPLFFLWKCWNYSVRIHSEGNIQNTKRKMHVGIGISQFSKARACTIAFIRLSRLVGFLSVCYYFGGMVWGEGSSCQVLQRSSFSIYPALPLPCKE